ncbi:MAG: rhodanese-like domain-containing protein [bacterium]|nr:rhodanese [Deltaproteobacteria bacterium]MCP4906969.1 rhodanese-like domain-containing protein [bacterium]
MTIRDGLSYKALLDEANAEIETLSLEALRDGLHDPDLAVIDLRDIRELQREGQLPGAIHAPRGMLEFWIDPDSPYSKPIFQEDKRFVFYCQSGWRSALACSVAGRLGLQRASHLEGGFIAWKDAGGEIVPYEKKKR